MLRRARPNRGGDGGIIGKLIPGYAFCLFFTKFTTVLCFETIFLILSCKNVQGTSRSSGRCTPHSIRIT